MYLNIKFYTLHVTVQFHKIHIGYFLRYTLKTYIWSLRVCSFMKIKAVIFFFWLLPVIVLSQDIDDLYFIDAHSQIDKFVSIEKIIEIMDENGVKTTLLATRHGRKPTEVLEYANKYKGKIVPILATKQFGYLSDDKKKYIETFKKLSKKEYQGIAEVLMWHSGCPNNKCPAVERLPDDTRVQKILNIAKKKGWPFVAHIEFGSLYFGNYSTYMNGFEELLIANESTPFALIHMGQLESEDVERLIKQYKNIHFLTAHTNPKSKEMAQGFKPWINMFDGHGFREDWKRLLVQYPDRFIFAMDNVWGDTHWISSVYKEQIDYWKKALSQLPSNVAHAIAHANAERLWKLK